MSTWIIFEGIREKNQINWLQRIQFSQCDSIALRDEMQINFLLFALVGWSSPEKTPTDQIHRRVVDRTCSDDFAQPPSPTTASADLRVH